MTDPLMRLSNEELVRQGYLVVQRFGNTTRYVPTHKYRDTMRVGNETAMVLVGKGVLRSLPSRDVHTLLAPNAGRYCVVNLLPEGEKNGEQE